MSSGQNQIKAGHTKCHLVTNVHIWCQIYTTPGAIYPCLGLTRASLGWSTGQAKARIDGARICVYLAPQCHLVTPNFHSLRSGACRNSVEVRCFSSEAGLQRATFPIVVQRPSLSDDDAGTNQSGLFNLGFYIMTSNTPFLDRLA